MPSSIPRPSTEKGWLGAVPYVVGVVAIVVDVCSQNWSITWPIVALMVLFFVPTIFEEIGELRVSVKDGSVEISKHIKEKIERATIQTVKDIEEFDLLFDGSLYDENTVIILDALATGRYTFRSISGISQSTGIDAIRIVIDLVFLKADGIVNERDTDTEYKWSLSDKGRNALAKYKNKPSQELQ
ncbi:MAG: hypothetical protein AAGK00_16660 [Pseudomonadota bacterium]